MGQAHLVGERGPLRRSVARGHLASLLLWGPPGTGKTSPRPPARGRRRRRVPHGLGRDVGRRRGARRRSPRPRTGWPSSERRSVLFIDEIHRFNKAQQDALLPHVEDGTVTLIGATTENPYFEVNSALLSRMRVWRLEPLTDDDVAAIVRRALEDEERGLAGVVRPERRRRAWPTSRSTTSSRSPAATRARRSTSSRARSRSPRTRTPATPTAGSPPPSPHVEAAAQQRVLAYDRAGDGHYDTVSAFIKSLRGNDPDGALYWLASMVAAGEDPRFIVRRLIIAASEDVGQRRPARAPGGRRRRAGAGPRRAARGAVRAGPGDDLHRDGAQVEPRRRPRTGRRASDVVERGSLPVPNHLKTAGDRRMKHHGIGVGYRYPHEFAGPRRGRSSTCPTSSRTAATTCRPSRATSGRSASGWTSARHAARPASRNACPRPRQRHERHRRRDEGAHRVPEEARGYPEEGRRLARPGVRRRRLRPAAGTGRSATPRSPAAPVGVPLNTTRPPLVPPSGPRSMIQSALRIDVQVVLDHDHACCRRRPAGPGSRAGGPMSDMCSPVVGSSST